MIGRIVCRLPLNMLRYCLNHADIWAPGIQLPRSESHIAALRYGHILAPTCFGPRDLDRFDEIGDPVDASSLKGVMSRTGSKTVCLR